MKKWLSILALLWLFSCHKPTGTMFPTDRWTEAAPEEVAVDSRSLDEAVAFLRDHSGRDGCEELMIVRAGRLIYQGDSIHKVHGIWSCTKSFTSTVLGLLIDEHKAQLSTFAKTIIPEMEKNYPEVQLSHFVTMTSGYKSVGDTATSGYTHGSSRTPFIPDTTSLFAPGKNFAYWDAAMNQFAQILTIIAQEPLDEFFKRRIADPIGMKKDAWHWGNFGPVKGTDVVGGAGNGGRGVFISANALARFGLLLLNEGTWNGTQLVSKDWIQQATKVQVPNTMKLGTPLSTIDGVGVYGFNWWVNGIQSDGNRLWPDVPPSTFAASGYNNNKMFVIPAWDMVVVRLGLDDRDITIPNSTWNDFLRKVGEAIK